MTDEEILDQINKGLIYWKDGDIYYWHMTYNRWKKKKRSYDRNGRAQYRFNRASKRTIGANRLIWMVHNKRIPEGVIDHIDENRFNDDPSNLQEMSYEDSNKQGYRIQQEKTLASLCSWFENKAPF